MSTPSVLIRDYMRDLLVTLSPDMDVLRAIHLLLENDVPGAPVLDRLGNIVGFLSEKDAMAVAADASYYEDVGGFVKQVMAKKVSTVDADDSIITAAKLFQDTEYQALPVMLNGRLAGVLTRRDVLRMFEDKR